MPAYPTSPRSAFLAWCNAHISIFQANAEVIGLTDEQALAFKAATQSAQASDLGQTAAKLALRAATQDANDRFSDLRKSASEMVRSIRTFAQNTDDPTVYVIAQVPPPADPSTAPPPCPVGSRTSTRARRRRWWR
jgi:hypothetical protein